MQARGQFEEVIRASKPIRSLTRSDILIGTDNILFDISEITAPTAGATLSEAENGQQLTALGPITQVTFHQFESATLELGQNSDELTLDLTAPDLTLNVMGAAGDDMA